MHAGAMQEPILLTMTRLALLLPSVDLKTQPILDSLQIVTDSQSRVSSAASPKKASLLFKVQYGGLRLSYGVSYLFFQRCEQFCQAVRDPSRITNALEGKEVSSVRSKQSSHNLNDTYYYAQLPSFAQFLDQVSTPAPPSKQELESEHQDQPSRTKSPAPLAQSKLRYDAYAPPTAGVSMRLGRARNHSSLSPTMELKVLRSPSSASVSTTTGREVEDRTPGASTPMSPDEKPATQRPSSIAMPSKASSSKASDPLIALDSPFMSEPLVDMNNSIGTGNTPPYVSANTSLRATPEPGIDYEELWVSMVTDERVKTNRGWYEGAVEEALLELEDRVRHAAEKWSRSEPVLDCALRPSWRRLKMKRLMMVGGYMVVVSGALSRCDHAAW